ncbi:hypothetical protein KNT75_gp92 [Gordonia phage Kabluna]|uniref:Uncharacterized protein n=1 Tax=Gordonia phage Kabluna TaxID=2041511 RepID=A0A2D1GCL2_9CAUD|nr:hypothetical protein KNT75_gp92 [Gordonia phage Kabluna]ATN89611.1 hypothetical protein SEA_KABLUNA_92 [Gordonia phage Kabluna]
MSAGEVRDVMHDVVGVGDLIICRGEYHRVTAVVEYGPGDAPDTAPMRRDWWVREYRTAVGSRWRGFPQRPTD